jgi:hypothetical protein
MGLNLKPSALASSPQGLELPALSIPPYALSLDVAHFLVASNWLPLTQPQLLVKYNATPFVSSFDDEADWATPWQGLVGVVLIHPCRICEFRVKGSR